MSTSQSVPLRTADRTPNELARETLKLLASRREPATPDNYVRVYAEIAGTAVAFTGITSGAPLAAAVAANASAGPDAAPKEDSDWSQVIRDLLRQLDLRHPGLSPAQKRDGLERVLINFRRTPLLGDKLAALVRSWGEAKNAEAAPVVRLETAVDIGAVEVARAEPAAAESPVAGLAQALRGVLVAVLERELAPRVAARPVLASAVSRVAGLVKSAQTPADCTALDAAIVQLIADAARDRDEQTHLLEDSMGLVRMLVSNLGELVDDDRWVAGQVELVGRIVAQPPTARLLADAQIQFREAVERQSALKNSLRDMKHTLKELIGVFVERVGEMSRSAVDYHARIGHYAEAVRSTDNVHSLRGLLDELMGDIRQMQLDATRSRDDVLGVRAQADHAQAKVAELEGELARVSTALREDALTGALNRRGLDEALEREAARAERYRSPLCLAMIDLDNFKKLNDRLGHQAGDEALRHLISVVKPLLRPSDTVGRYGGEEFVLVLPETPIADARVVVERLQRELTRRYFLNNNEKVLITFSAGVAEMAPGESRELLVRRADEAMYEAKRQGRNRVLAA